MTQAFILVTLADRQAFTFGDPVLNWVKQNFPHVMVLDIDAFSDDYLVSQACSLIKESSQAVIYFKVNVPNLPIGAGIRVLEAVLQAKEKGFVLLNGEHRQLQAILTDRPQVNFQKVGAVTASEVVLQNIFG